jgi:type IV pilus biogenesis protein CpaD/CtpE
MLGIFLLMMAAPVAAPTAVPVPWGQANAANLAAMARPADLARPVPMGPASGHLEAAAVARLLADKARDLRRENAAQAGGGGAPR